MILYRPVGTKELKLIEENNYCKQFEVHQVGREYHKELWIPAERLEEFNEHIIGKICVISEFPNK